MYGDLICPVKKRVYVVIVNWNGWNDTIECLESLFNSDYPDYRVIVCDNGSTDESLEQIKRWADGTNLFEICADSKLSYLTAKTITKPIEYIEYSRIVAEAGGVFSVDTPLVLINTNENLGFAGGNNVGMHYALARNDFDYIWLLNNDTVVKPFSLTALVNRMKEKPEAGMCGSAIFYYKDPGKVQALGGGWHCKWIGLPWHYGRFNGRYDADNLKIAEAWMNYVEGASMLVSREFVIDIGLMCEDYFLFFEETDWAIRAKEKYALAYAPKSVIYHKVGGSIGTSSNPFIKSATCDYYNIRNRLLFTSRFYPLLIPLIIFVIILEILFSLVFLMPKRSALLCRLIWQYFFSRQMFFGDCRRQT